jgi:glycosyltransferase involved in cell wall biosynthesis
MNPHLENLVAAPAAKVSDSEVWPRITLVTAVRNGAKYLEDTICSIVNQGYPNLEYIIVDGVSTDGTIDIIRKYESQLAWWVSQPDKGVYDALNTGFAQCTGEIMGWLNASDMLHTHGLFVVGSVLGAFPQVEWITGRPTVFNEQGMPIEVQRLHRWSRYRFLAGASRHIQQESTFWRRSLWERAGGQLDTSYRAEGDFDLWVRFFRHAHLYSVDALIAGYRFHRDALSYSNIDLYNRTCDAIIERELEFSATTVPVRLFRRISQAVQPIPFVRGIWRRLAVQSLYQVAGPDWTPKIHFSNGQWTMCP